MTRFPIYWLLTAALVVSSCVFGPKEDYSGVPYTPTVADQVGRIDLSSYWSSPLECWDEMHALSTLQGIVNRTTATLYIDYVSENGKNIDKTVVETVSGSHPNYILLDAPSFFELVRISEETRAEQ